jgi:hypothetical protein
MFPHLGLDVADKTGFRYYAILAGKITCIHWNLVESELGKRLQAFIIESKANIFAVASGADPKPSNQPKPLSVWFQVLLSLKVIVKKINILGVI